MCDKKLNSLLDEVRLSKTFALGYPVNREHAFHIDLNTLGIQENSFASTFMNNVGIPFAPRSYRIDDIKDLEEEVIRLIFEHLGGIKNEAFGYITCGGTEANFAAIWWHREFLLNRFGGQAPVLISSTKSHYSLDKIANQLSLVLIKLDADNLNKSLEMTLSSITSPVIYWANIGATVDGEIDDISKIDLILKKYCGNKYKIHGDGAIYGLLIPYLKIFSSINNIFDSLSISGHKFLGTYNICGIILSKLSYINMVFADKDKRVSYTRNSIDYTVSGSRPGIHIIELYLLLEKAFKIDNSNKKALEEIWVNCLNLASWFYEKLREIVSTDNKLLHYNSDQLSIIFPAPKLKDITFKLSEKFALMPVGDKQLGIYVLPRSSENKLKEFLKDYKNSGNLYAI